MKSRFVLAASLAAFSVLGAYACTASAPVISPATDPAAISVISASAMLDHIKVLASDEFEGRAPGSKGEALTVAYVSQQFKKLGLAPGNPDGTYLQNESGLPNYHYFQACAEQSLG